jgi:hypothetical protein
VSDADAMTTFLTVDLNVPLGHITVLRNDQATRAAIKHAIDGLSKDVRIQTGDPILIYFAGHGGMTEAWPDWKERNGSNFIQVIFPWDYNALKSERGKSVHPIPDRTIRGLVNRLAKTKGDNIVRQFHLVLLQCRLTGIFRL